MQLPLCRILYCFIDVMVDRRPKNLEASIPYINLQTDHRDRTWILQVNSLPNTFYLVFDNVHVYYNHYKMQTELQNSFYRDSCFYEGCTFKKDSLKKELFSIKNSRENCLNVSLPNIILYLRQIISEINDILQ